MVRIDSFLEAPEDCMNTTMKIKLDHEKNRLGGRQRPAMVRLASGVETRKKKKKGLRNDREGRKKRVGTATVLTEKEQEDGRTEKNKVEYDITIEMYSLSEMESFL